jgi:hypothetical protein
MLFALAGCSEGQLSTVPMQRLVRFHDGKGNYAQYIPMEMPGRKASSSEDVESNSIDENKGPVVNYDTTPGWVYQGQSNGKLSGVLSSDSVAIGLSAPDVEKGYWVKPAGVPDPVTKQLTWTAFIEISEDVEPGYHDITMVGINDSGEAGEIVSYPLCVRSRIPDNFNSCDASADAPNAVISLSWDSNVDLDLQVVTPEGNVVNSKNPTTNPIGDTVEASVGVIDRDSNASCLIDGIRYENLVWNSSKPKGRYGIYVNLFDSCKQPTVHFEVNVYSAIATKAAGMTLKKYFSKSGVLMDYQANGGSKRGLFITEFDFE